MKMNSRCSSPSPLPWAPLCGEEPKLKSPPKTPKTKSKQTKTLQTKHKPQTNQPEKKKQRTKKTQTNKEKPQLVRKSKPSTQDALTKGDQMQSERHMVQILVSCYKDCYKNRKHAVIYSRGKKKTCKWNK